MGSLNGDIMVKRNGRCTSQVSVYNYPEHLNPFYEDDQHKRLRFWTLKKYKDQGRSNSISFSNLKDIWGFKSFRLNKKSSTLGINKTSESPPLLRRQFQQNGCNTSDYNESPMYGDNLQRNTISRSSFKNLLAQDRMGFNRNDNYRSTIQVADFNHMRHVRQQPPSAGLRYVYRGSMTPQPLRNVDKNDQYNNINNNNNYNNSPQKESSRVSVISTNPFDTEYESGNINVRNINGNIATKKHTPYKKRRAPPPPPSVVSVSASGCTSKIFAESSQNDGIVDNNSNNINSNELCIAENTDIANLTAEIEHFVETKNNANIERDKIKTSTLTECNINCSNTSDTQRTTHLENSPKTKMQSSTSATIINVTKESVYDNVKPIESKHENSKNNSTDNADKDSFEKTLSVKAAVLQKEVPKHEELPNTTTTNSDISSNKSPNSTVPPEEKQPKTSITDLSSDLLEEIEKPTPIKRKPKIDMEQTKSNQTGYQQFTTFKPSSGKEIQIDKQITAKTSFTLASPPPKRKDDTDKENTRKLDETDESKQNSNQVKASPKLSFTNSSEGSEVRPRFAQIHKPTRNKFSQKLVDVTREELIVPVKHDLTDSSYKIQKVNEKIPANYPKHNTYDKSNGSLNQNNQPALQIIEPTSGNSDDDKNINKENATFEAESIYRHRGTPQEWKQSTLAPLEINVPPEKRKSVKDIIESINRSQRILNASANKDFPVWPDRAVIDNDNIPQQNISNMPIADDKRSNFMVNENLKMLDESEQKLKQMMNEIESSIKNQQTESTLTGKKESATILGTNLDLHVSPQMQKNDYQQKIDNNDIIRKDNVIKERGYDSRESSPISSNLDWNPLPKPKRIKPIKENNP